MVQQQQHQMVQQQQHHFQQMQMQQQQHYGLPPPMAFYPGGHQQSGLMRPGFPPRPGAFQGMPGPRPPPGQPFAAGLSSCSSDELCHDQPGSSRLAACGTATCAGCLPLHAPLCSWSPPHKFVDEL
jgi:hypothetical protein